MPALGESGLGGMPGRGGAYSGGMPGPGGAWLGGAWSGGMPGLGGAWSGGCLVQGGGLVPGGARWRSPPPATVRLLLWALRILLECILVTN